MDYVRIGKLVKKTKQVKPDELGRTHFTYVDISSIDRELKVISEAQYLPVDEAPSRARKSIENNDILVSTVRPNLNAVALVTEEYHQEIASTGFCVIRPIPECLDENYLFYLTQTSDFVDYLVRIATGASYPAVSDSDILKFEIPLPPLDEQKRIAAILEEADHARRTRRFTQSVSDTFLQEVFVEMFGDLAERWQFRKLGQLADVVSGVTKGQKFNGRETVEVPYLRVANVQDGYLDLSEIKLIRALPSEVQKYTLQPGDVVMTEGGDYDKLGRGAIWRGEIEGCIHQNHVFRVRVDRECLLPQFFAAYLQSTEAKLYFLGASKQTTNLASINMTQLRALPVPLPPMELQRHFADTISKFERVENQQHESARQAEHLFQTLLHRAFRGEV